ncbi:phospholipase A and acyltransferase 3-like [Micropterus dolomieu]|uniref:phospholipase A and acyltransferase 3-like n=1 Tax=Micropterus dolomieu TaxID=147949 RepID=UPI001E8E22B0|nr:phospholipase A and acyltransferase 3-like [Micropterus dolomieu]XP_045885664.1 phospholipase A and acyltransferase 3-like [Micropterus dolomieu]
MMSVLTGKAMVKKEKLQDVVGNKWKINNSLDEKYKPCPVQFIVKEACACVGKELPYCIFRGNCEHFANELRYGKKESRQALLVFAPRTTMVILGIHTGSCGKSSVWKRQKRKQKEHTVMEGTRRLHRGLINRSP